MTASTCGSMPSGASDRRRHRDRGCRREPADLGDGVHGNVAVEAKSAEAEKLVNDWRVDHQTDFSTLNFLTMIDMLTDAINKAGSTDPLKVALALEDMHAKDLVGQENIMRKEDHQLLMPYYVGVFSKDVKYDAEHTGFGWKNIMTATAADLTLPTICKMKRPD